MPTKAKAASTLKDEKTGLAIVAVEGDAKKLRLDIKKESHAVKAMEIYVQNEEKLETLKRKIAPLEAERELIRAGMKAYQEEKEITDFSSNGWVSELIERTKSFFVLTPEDIPENLDMSKLDEQPKPLTEIMEEKFPDNKSYRRVFNKITKRVLSPDKLDAAVKEGIFTAEELQPAFLEYTDTSYVMIKQLKK